jgi:FMN phosphatase YigB (HAD superfamily)
LRGGRPAPNHPAGIGPDRPPHRSFIDSPRAWPHKTHFTFKEALYGDLGGKPLTTRFIRHRQGTVLSAEQFPRAQIPGKYFGIVRCFRYGRAGATHLSGFYHTEGIVLGEELNLRTYRMRGEIDSCRFWDNFRNRTGLTVRGDLWYDCFDPHPNRGTAAITTGLRNSGYRVVCSTNTMKAHYHKHQERGDYRSLGAVYASRLMGIIKREPDFWRYILKQEQVSPTAVFFSDDLEENTKAAEKMGIAPSAFLPGRKN